jgi:hypothetical protein
MAFRGEGEEFTEGGEAKLLPLSGKAVLGKREALQTEMSMTYPLATWACFDKTDRGKGVLR